MIRDSLRNDILSVTANTSPSLTDGISLEGESGERIVRVTDVMLGGAALGPLAREIKEKGRTTREYSTFGWQAERETREPERGTGGTGGGAGVPGRVARPWLSGNRQRSGAIKRVICALQFDPAALGAVSRSASNSREFLGVRGLRAARPPGPCTIARPMPPSSPRSPLSRSIRHSVEPNVESSTVVARKTVCAHAAFSRPIPR